MSPYRLRPAGEEDLAALLRILDAAVGWLGAQGTDQWAGARWRADELRPDITTGGLRVAETWVDARLTRGASTSRPVPGEVEAVGQGAAGLVSPLVSGEVSAAAEEAGSSGGGASAAGEAGAESSAGAERRSGPIPIGTMTLRDSPGDDPWQPGDDPASALYLHHLAVDRAFAGKGVGAWLIDRAAEEAARRGKRALRLDAWTANTRLHAYYLGQGFRLVRIDRRSASGALFERPVSLR